ncbi:MAG: NAD-dependent epimerase/dehydratase family protein [Gammaproteobacteria bacterium]|nr:NAD-dependent epimerase/dehydratase family protein [Gammaproteobacteria bacterium]
MTQVEPAPIPHRGSGPVLTFGLTGANGFVGSNLCRHLLAAGHRVQALVRAGADRRGIANMPELQVHEGDLGDAASLQRAFAGCTVVVHAAARTADWGAWKLFEAANVRGVTEVLAAARASVVRRVVHLSTVSVYGFPGLVEVTEDQPWLARPRDPYISSKQQGERLARAAHGADLEVTVLRPGGLYGPHDRITSAPLFAALERGRLPLVDRGRHLLAPAYVDNLVQAIWLAATRPNAAGRVYNITDAGRITWHDYLFAACEELGCPPPRRSLPAALALPLAAAVEDVSRWLRPDRMPPLTRYRIRAVMADSHFDCQRARDELGYAPVVATREGLRRTVAWYRATP